ncbi:MAG: hypothetical protein K8T90_11425 [Planctomycetes bacterium]|nr:hypothetical protein [Planctomycetota bacterium]
MKFALRTALLAVGCVALLGLGAASCGLMQAVSGERVAFDALAAADRVVVRGTSMDDERRTITDRASIASLAAFAADHADGWETPWYGPPVALLRADFYVGETYVRHLGVGSNFLTTDEFLSRSVNDGDRAAVMKLLGVADPYDARTR